MFSRYRIRPVATAALTCFAAVLFSAFLVTQPSHARTDIRAVQLPGDPDEFESRVPDSGPSAGGRAALSNDASAVAERRASIDACRDGAAGRRVAPRDRRGAVSLLVRRFVRFLMIELDVM